MKKMPKRERPYIIVCTSLTNWLVLATSAEEALADWPSDAETACEAHLASREEAEWCHEVGNSDLNEDEFAAAFRRRRR